MEPQEADAPQVDVAANRAGDPAGLSSDEPESAASARLRDEPGWIVILVLHLGLFGIPLYWRTRYPVSVRLLIVVVSLVYSLLFGLVVFWGGLQIVRLVRELSS